MERESQLKSASAEQTVEKGKEVKEASGEKMAVAKPCIFAQQSAGHAANAAKKGWGTAPAGACGSGAPLADNRAESAALSAQTPPQGQCRGMCRAKRPPKAAVRGEWSQRPCPQAAFSTSCSASAENRTQKDKDKARQPLGAMFQRAAVLYRVKINFEFTLKRVKSLPTPILLYGAFLRVLYGKPVAALCVLSIPQNA